jgi:hexokinase
MNTLLHIPNYDRIAESFYHELQTASKGKQGNLHYIKTYAIQKPLITEGHIQTIVIGGTYLESAIFALESGKEPLMLSHEKSNLIPINSMEDFRAILDMHLMAKVNGIALNIGFPLSYIKGEKGQADGSFIKSTKEHKLHGLLGHPLGEIVLERYIRQQNAYAIVAAANDVSCLAKEDGGIIIGTGYNLAIADEDEAGKFSVNLEAGNAASYESTAELEEIDRASTHPGVNRFEKLVSGSYLPVHFNLLARKYAIDTKVKRAEELSELAAQGDGEAGELAKELFERSAKYAAAQIAGLYKFKNSPERMTIYAEGSLYNYGYKYQKSLQQGLRALGIAPNAIQIKSTINGNLLGALHLLV